MSLGLSLASSFEGRYALVGKSLAGSLAGSPGLLCLGPRPRIPRISLTRIPYVGVLYNSALATQAHTLSVGFGYSFLSLSPPDHFSALTFNSFVSICLAFLVLPFNDLQKVASKRALQLLFCLSDPLE